MLCNFEGKVQSKMALGEEFRINIGNMNTENMSKSDCIQSKHKETLNQIKIMIGSCKKLNQSDSIDKEFFSTLMKKFLFTVASIRDDFFLSDACELAYELFIEFRIILGYLEKPTSTSEKKLKLALKDVEEMCEELGEMFKEFLIDTRYEGTKFPKPANLKAMRELVKIVGDASDVVILTKSESGEDQKKNMRTTKQPIYVAIDMKLDNEAPLRNNTNNHKSTQNRESSVLSLTSASESETNMLLLKTKGVPSTPKLYSDDVSAMRVASCVRGNNNNCVLVAAMGELMPAPPLPTSEHGRISYVQVANRVQPITAVRALTGTFKPPILVDDDGDILPSSGPMIPQLKSASASIYESSYGRFDANENISHHPLTEYFSIDTPKGLTPRTKQPKVLEDDDSFIIAYREQAMEEICASVQDRRKGNVNDFGSSGWSVKNRM